MTTAAGWPIGSFYARWAGPSGIASTSESGGTLAVVPDPAGGHQITGQGYLRIPAEMHHRCGLASGDRVLLAADPDRSHLAIYPPAAMDKALDPTRR